MARIAEFFDFGGKDTSTEELIEKLERMYTNLALAVNSKPDLYQRQTNGLTSDTFLAQGAVNINLSTNKVEMLTQHVDSTTVIWTTLS